MLTESVTSIYSHVASYWLSDQNVMPKNTKSITKRQMTRHSNYRGEMFCTTALGKLEHDYIESIRFYCQMLMQDISVCTIESQFTVKGRSP